MYEFFGGVARILVPDNCKTAVVHNGGWKDRQITETYQELEETLKQYQKYTLLILDEWLLVKLTETEARDLLEIIHARHHKASTSFCSQFAPKGWYKKFPEEQIADAILDRIVHDSYLIEIRYIDKERDKSMREAYGIKENS